MIRKLLLVSALLCTASTFGQTLIAHWAFNNGQAIDSVNGLNGTVTNCISVAGSNGLANSALQFNGIDSKVDIPFNGVMNVATFTIQAMVKVTGFNTAMCESSSILWRGIDGGSDHYNMIISDNMYNNCGAYDSSSMRFTSGVPGTNPNPASSYQYSWGGIAYNQWYCVTATYDGVSLKQYVNGSLAYTLNYPNQFFAGTDPINIGYYLQGGGSYPYFFKGIIDDIKIWNGVINLEAITQSCTATQTLPPATAITEITSIISSGVSPNPFNDRIKVTINLGVSAALQLNLYNGMGQKVLGQLVNGVRGENEYYLDANMLPSGIYWLQMFDGKTKSTVKLVKQ